MPQNTINLRGKFFLEKKYSDMLELYSERSPYHEYFKKLSDYEEYMNKYCQTKTFIKTDIVSVKKRGSLAKITYHEEFIENGQTQYYLAETTLTYEQGCWKILNEKRRLT